MRGNVDPELWFEDIVVSGHFIAGEYEVRGVSDDQRTTSTSPPLLKARRFVVSGDPDLLSIKEHEDLCLVAVAPF